MSENDNTINFAEFQELCQAAGISVDNLQILEQDFRAGTALADVTDALIQDYENKKEAYTAGEGLKNMDIAFTLLAESEDIAASRIQAKKLAVYAIRYMAEVCHDEGKN